MSALIRRSSAGCTLAAQVIGAGARWSRERRAVPGIKSQLQVVVIYIWSTNCLSTIAQIIQKQPYFNLEEDSH